MSSRDVYSKLTSNLSQSIFAFLVGSIFSGLILLLFSMDSLMLFIFEIPLAFLIALIVMSECLYQYKDEVSLDQTVRMIGPLLKSILISIPVVFLYSSLIIILQAVVTSFREALLDFLNTHAQALREVIIAVPVIFFLPNLIMATTMPLLLYIYGKVHVLIFGNPKEKNKAKKTLESERAEIEFREKLDETLQKLSEEGIRMQQYLLELQVMPKEIERVDSHEAYKALFLRLEMMRSYVESVGEPPEKEYKAIYETEEVKKRLSAIDIQRKAIIDQAKNYIKELKKSKAKYEKPEEEEEEELEE
ncbi:MAG: hypothetical protein ACTSQE_01455 [Candidatus Heimdallarchaeaceae archaeon]